jgi:hypothetical protein
MIRSPLAIALVGASLLLVACYGPPPGVAADDDGETPPNTECQPPAPAGKEPGYPFNVESFRGDVLPVLAASCGTANCHKDPTGLGNFTIFSTAAQDECDFAETFDQVAKQITLTSPKDSRLLVAPSGGSARHPKVLDATTQGYATLQAYIDDAVLRSGAGGGGPPASDDPHDATVFKTVIQPMIDKYACTTCHASGAGQFKVTANATGAELDANFTEVTKRNDLASPEKSRVYFKGLNSHAGSQIFAAGDAQKFLDWVKAAATAAP